MIVKVLVEHLQSYNAKLARPRNEAQLHLISQESETVNNSPGSYKENEVDSETGSFLISKLKNKPHSLKDGE